MFTLTIMFTGGTGLVLHYGSLKAAQNHKKRIDDALVIVTDPNRLGPGCYATVIDDWGNETTIDCTKVIYLHVADIDQQLAANAEIQYQTQKSNVKNQRRMMADPLTRPPMQVAAPPGFNS